MYGLFMYLSGTPRERVWKSPETHGEALCLRRMCLRVGPYSGQLYVVCGLREEATPPYGRAGPLCAVYSAWISSFLIL